MGKVILFAFAAALNPTLLAATTVMMLFPKPQKLLLGYLLGAALTSISIGLVIVFALEDSGAVEAAKRAGNPIEDVVLAAIALLIAYVLASERDLPVRERRRERKEAKEKGPPFWQRWLGRGSPRVTFAVGAVLTLPGASTLAGLDAIANQDLSTTETVLAVLGFNVIMLLLLELPLLGYALAPDWTPGAVERVKAQISSRGRTYAVRAAIVIATLLIIRAAVTAFS